MTVQASLFNPVYKELNQKTGALQDKRFLWRVVHAIFSNLAKLFCLGNRYEKRYLRKLSGQVIKLLNRQNELSKIPAHLQTTAASVKSVWEKRFGSAKSSEENYSYLQRADIALKYRIKRIQASNPSETSSSKASVGPRLVAASNLLKIAAQIETQKEIEQQPNRKPEAGIAYKAFDLEGEHKDLCEQILKIKEGLVPGKKAQTKNKSVQLKSSSASPLEGKAAVAIKKLWAEQREKLEQVIQDYERSSKSEGAVGKDEDKKYLESFYDLVRLATKWKLHEVAFCDDARSYLDQNDLNILMEVVEHYPEMAKLLSSDTALRKFFFSWCNLSGNSVESFVLFPEVTSLLYASRMAGHLSKKINANGCALKVRVEADKIDLTIPYMILKSGWSFGSKTFARSFWETKRLSLLNDLNVPILAHGYNGITLRQVIQTFKEKITIERIGDVEWSPIHNPVLERQVKEKESKEEAVAEGETKLSEEESGGIFPFHAWNQRIGSSAGKEGTLIDLSAERWWEQAPVARQMTFEQVQAYFQVDATLLNQEGAPRGTIVQGMPIFSLRAAYRPGKKGGQERSLSEAHGYMEVAVPVNRGLTYHVYAIGKFTNAPGEWVKQAKRIPGFIKKVAGEAARAGFIGSTVFGTLSIDDENQYKVQRRHTGYSFVGTDEELKALMKSVGERIQASFNRTDEDKPVELFSFAHRNCAEFCFSLFEKHFPRPDGTFPPVYRYPINRLDFPGPVKWMVNEKTTPNRLWWVLKFFAAGRYKQVPGLGGQKKTESVLNEYWKQLKDNPRAVMALHYPPRIFETVDWRTGALIQEEIAASVPAVVAAAPASVPASAPASTRPHDDGRGLRFLSSTR